MTGRLRVLVVDDSAYIRKVVREMLSSHPSIDVVGTARDGDEALELVERLRPDVVTCDLIMPGTDGLCHISDFAWERVMRTEDVMNLGDEIEVQVTNIDGEGRVRLSRKALLPKPEGYVEPPPREDRGGGGGGRGGDRGGRDRDRGGRGGGGRGGFGGGGDRRGPPRD